MEETPRTGSRLLRDEDWLSVWLALLMITAVLLGLRPEMPKSNWATDGAVTARKAAVEQLVREAETQGRADLAAAAANLRDALNAGDRTAAAEAARQLSAASDGASGAAIASRASQLAEAVGNEASATPGGVFAVDNLLRAAVIGAAFLAVSAAGIALLGGQLSLYVIGFPVVYALAWLAQIAAGNSTVEYWGLEYVIFALGFGLLISNLFRMPAWLREAVRTEYYIKTGLVILGAGILFPEILQAGFVGVLQALLVIGLVWYACFYLARRLRVDDEFAVMLSTAVSICGVSAAIAACGAIQGDRRKLSYVTSLVLIVAVPMMVLMPWAVKFFGIPDIVGGAWVGGAIDTSGAVVAAGALVSEAAMKAAVIVKFSQNALIGLAAFALSLWWVLRKGDGPAERPSASIIWERFPKFVLGFMAVSVVFSFFIDPSLVAETKGTLTDLRTVWFALAFTCIGLETRFRELVAMEGGRPAIAFLGAQAVNIVWTLVIAYLLFGGFLFPSPEL